MPPVVNQERKSAYTERRYWANLSALDITVLTTLAVLLLGMIWILWNQSQQQNAITGFSTQLNEQNRQLNNLTQQLAEHERNRAAAAAEAKRSPTTIVVPPAAGTSTTIPNDQSQQVPTGSGTTP